MNAGLDAAIPQAFHEGLAIGAFWQKHGEDMIRGLSLFCLGERQTNAQSIQRSPVGMGQITAAVVIALQFLQLGDAQGCPQFINAVIVAQINHVIRKSMTFVAIIGQAGHAV